ncbi:MAG: sugar-binding domain-containing protein, partial [Acutalibacteraceae bacterium]
MRETIKINNNWKFKKGISEAPECFPYDWETTDLPFTWNGFDGQDGGNDYFRGKYCFVKQIIKAEIPKTDEIYIQFDGVNSSASIFFNGENLAVHHGGYSTFRAKLSNIKEENLLAVIVDNGVNDFVYPQMADFTFYGGIYRDVS